MTTQVTGMAKNTAKAFAYFFFINRSSSALRV
jgi:hypothetical protein